MAEIGITVKSLTGSVDPVTIRGRGLTAYMDFKVTPIGIAKSPGGGWRIRYAVKVIKLRRYHWTYWFAFVKSNVRHLVFGPMKMENVALIEYPDGSIENFPDA